jgi:hypothetical protein
MYEIDFLPVGDEGQSGDAIAARFTRADTGGLAHVIVDAGFHDDGVALVEHVQRYFETSEIDLAIVTHPDGDHIGGMGEVIRGLNVGVLCIHRLGERGGASLPAAAAVDELIALAAFRGTAIHEPFSGSHAFGQALVVAGPDPGWYEALVAQQVEEERTSRGGRRASGVRAAVRSLSDRILAALPPEVRFDDAGGTNPRNNTSVVTMINVAGYRIWLTGDAGVPSLERAWRWLGVHGYRNEAPNLAQIPHAGSRHNASSDFLDELLGPTGQEPTRKAQVSVASKAKKHPSPRVVNAYMRRGCSVYETRGVTIHHFSRDAPDRGWTPVTPLSPMSEDDEG